MEKKKEQAETNAFDDFAGMLGGALGVLGGVREQLQAEIRACVDKLISDMDVVTREEYDAVLMMAQKARMEQESMLQRIDDLEKQLRQK